MSFVLFFIIYDTILQKKSAAARGTLYIKV